MTDEPISIIDIMLDTNQTIPYKLDYYFSNNNPNNSQMTD